jgi:hypothetical protein
VTHRPPPDRGALALVYRNGVQEWSPNFGTSCEAPLPSTSRYYMLVCSQVNDATATACFLDGAVAHLPNCTVNYPHFAMILQCFSYVTVALWDDAPNR